MRDVTLGYGDTFNIVDNFSLIIVVNIATGIMVVTHLPEGQQAPGTLVDERTYAPFHQHFVVARLDLGIDGTDNTVYCCDSEGLPIAADNPLGLTLVQRQTPLRTEADGRQDYRWDTQRSWKIVSESTRNRLGTPTGYKLVPGGCFPPMMDPASPVFRRAQVIGHTLWVTPYQPEERWPCGEFCNQSDRDDGLPAWTAKRALLGSIREAIPGRAGGAGRRILMRSGPLPV
jgi:primary-amine oxidase